MSLSAAASLFLLFLFCEVEQTYSSWGVTYGSQYICALKGSTVRMSCMYRHPSQEGNIKISVTQTFWFAKTDEGPVDVKTQEEYADRLEYSSSKKNCTLTIRDVKESDSAVYKFRFITSRSGGSYTGEPGVVLIVTDSDPNLTVRKKSSSWNSNLICSSSCVLPDHSTYVWYKNGKDMEIGTYVYNTWVDSDDTLSCALKGREDFPSPLFCVNNKRCNKVTYSHARICALKGSSVSFYSSFNSYYSSDFVILFWFSPGRSKEPEDLRQDPRYLGRVHVINTIPQSTLTIKNLTENDSAEYRFIFKTNRVTWGSDLHGTTLTVTDLQVEVTRTSTNQDPQYAELKCHSRCTPTGYHYYKWFRNGQDIGHSKSTYKVLINTTDRISCSVLSFKEHKAPEVYAPVLTSVSADPSDGIVEGNRVFLKCSSDANPPANYTWYKKTKMSAHPLHRKDSEFYLNPIQASDSGEYFCVAKNQLGESRSGNLNIDVKYAPKRADVSLSHAEIVEGDSVNLTCSSDGNPAPFNRWYKDNQMMLQGQGGVYQFTSVKSEDSGTYCCEVGNIYGQINSSTVLINVEYSPRLPSVSVNPPGDVAAGSSVNLTCSSAANPAATYAWYKEDSTSPAADGQTFTIVDIRGEHGGNYYCQARNSRGHHNSTLHLIVVSSSVSSAVVGSIMFLLLIGLFLSAFIIFRKKKAVRQIHQTREGPGDNEAKRLGNLGRHLESSSTAGLGNSADQDDVCYASVHFCKNQEEPLYSNFVPAEPKTSKNQEEDVEYSAVMIKNTPCRKSYDASDESSALYSTVCKVNRL